MYGALRVYANVFLSLLKLIEKTWNGSITIQRYNPSATPCGRLMRHDAISYKMSAARIRYRAELDPLPLAHSIREDRSVLVGRVLREPGKPMPRYGQKDADAGAEHHERRHRRRAWCTAKLQPPLRGYQRLYDIAKGLAPKMRRLTGFHSGP